MFRLLLLTASLCISLAGRQQDASAQLDQRVKAKLAGFQGHASLYAKNLETGATYSLRGDDPVRTASTIKLPIMVQCFSEAAEGTLKMAEPIKVTDTEKVSGSGIVQDLSAGDELPIRDLIDLMIVLSDNTATNMILNRIGGNAVNARMARLGLDQTRVMRKIRGDGKDLKAPSGMTTEGAKPENAKWGIGRSSPHEMVILLEKLYHGDLVNKASSEEMIAILKRQRDHDGIGRDMKDVMIANKSGALDALRSDVGIIYSKAGPIAMAITVDDMPQPDWSPDNPGNLLISSLSEILIEELGNPSAKQAAGN